MGGQREEPATLAAIQWRRIIETTRVEAGHLAPGRYKEYRYEDFAADPRSFMTSVYQFAGLDESVVRAREISMRTHHYGPGYDSKEAHAIVSVMQPVYSKLGYSMPRTDV